MAFLSLKLSPRAFLPLLLVVLCYLSPGVVLAQADNQAPAPAGTYQALAEVLENEQSRAHLIEELRRLAAEQQPPAEAGETGHASTFAGRLADASRSFANQLVAEVTGSVDAVAGLLRGDVRASTGELTRTTVELILLIVVTIGLFLLLRGLARKAFARMNTWALQPRTGSALLRRGAAVVAAAAIDVVFIVAAWVGGYAVALFVLGGADGVNGSESLFLNAFLAVEVFKVLVRTLFASKDDGLRLLPMGGEEAAYWNAWLSKVVSFIGYGLLFVVPLVNTTVSSALGRLSALLIMLVAFLYALVIILQNRDRVAGNLRERMQHAEMAFSRVMLGMLARCWHWIAIVYFAALALVTILRPEDALPFMLRATLQTLLAIGGGVFLSVVLSEIIGRHLRLADETRRRFPTLEARLNSYIPTALKAMRLLILAVVAMLVLDAWHLFNLASWLESETGIAILGTLVKVVLIIVLAAVVWIVLASWIEQRLSEQTGTLASARAKTLLAIFRSAAAVVLSVMTVMVVLSEIGINIGPLIAGAGVIGLAVGFGAQKLVQDIITGVFIQLENAINVGDFVTAGGFSGTVEKLTIRSFSMRDLSGTYHIVPFSSVDAVSNFMREYGYHMAEYGVAYREDVDEVMQRLREAFEELKQDPEQRDNILDELEIPGITKFDNSSVNIRVRIKAKPGTQWSLGRAYNRLVKRHFDAAGIEIPFPHTTLFFGQNKDGSAPPAFVRLETGADAASVSAKSENKPE